MSAYRLTHVLVILILLNIGLQAASMTDTSSSENVEYEIMPDDAYDHNDYFYKLHHLRESRINVNTCSLQNLLSIPVISFTTASAIIAYREKNGNIFSLRELFMVENADSTEISSLLPYLRIGLDLASERQKISSNASPYRMSFISRAINSSQMSDSYGSGMRALKIYSALRFAYNESVSLGICTEKDAGEKNIADYKSLFLRCNNLWGTEYILLGDYLTEFGKGLLLWAPFRQMNTAKSLNPQLGFGIGIREHSGTSESLFMRGAAFGLRFDYLLMECFYSHRPIDASFDSTGSYISYISLSGYHRSPLEIARQSSATENLAGTILTISNYRTYELKFLVMYDAYSVPLLPKLDLPQRALSGSVTYAFKRNSVFINGEIAHSNQKSGHITNITVNPVVTSSMILSYRHYAPSFLGIHSSAFSHNTETDNGEEGFYSGLHVSYRKFAVDMYADFYRTLATDRYGLCYMGNEYFASLSYAVANTMTHKLAVKYSKNECPVKGSLYLNKSSNTNLISWYDFAYKPRKVLTIKSRLGIIRNADTIQHRGFISYIHVNYRLDQSSEISGRAYFFNTDDYASGFFTSEGEVPGYVITSHLYEDGIRYFIAASTILWRHIHLSLKAAVQRHESAFEKKYFAQYSLQCELRY